MAILMWTFPWSTRKTSIPSTPPNSLSTSRYGTWNIPFWNPYLFRAEELNAISLNFASQLLRVVLRSLVWRIDRDKEKRNWLEFYFVSLFNSSTDTDFLKGGIDIGFGPYPSFPAQFLKLWLGTYVMNHKNMPRTKVSVPYFLSVSQGRSRENVVVTTWKRRQLTQKWKKQLSPIFSIMLQWSPAQNLKPTSTKLGPTGGLESSVRNLTGRVSESSGLDRFEELHSARIW